MKLKTTFLLLCLSALSFSPVFAESASDNKNQTQQMQAENKQMDAHVLAWLTVLDKNEIAAGKLALTKASNPMVKDYASMMVKQHNQNLQQTLILSHKMKVKPVMGDDANSLKKQGQKEKADLSSLKGADFQKAYIDAMVKGHTEGLSKLDEIMGTVQDAALKKQLEVTRKMVEEHLEKAKAVQSKL